MRNKSRRWKISWCILCATFMQFFLCIDAEDDVKKNFTIPDNDATETEIKEHRLFQPRMDYDKWTPLGRGDPLKNDPTYVYVPPVLERVHYWIDPSNRKPDPPIQNEAQKSEILVLGVSSKKSSAQIDSRKDYEPFLKFVDAPKFNHYRQSRPQIYNQNYYLKDRTFNTKIPGNKQKQSDELFTMLVPPPIQHTPPIIQHTNVKNQIDNGNKGESLLQKQSATSYNNNINVVHSTPSVQIQPADLVYQSSSLSSENEWNKNNHYITIGESSSLVTWRTPTPKPIEKSNFSFINSLNNKEKTMPESYVQFEQVFANTRNLTLKTNEDANISFKPTLYVLKNDNVKSGDVMIKGQVTDDNMDLESSYVNIGKPDAQIDSFSNGLQISGINIQPPQMLVRPILQEINVPSSSFLPNNVELNKNVNLNGQELSTASSEVLFEQLLNQHVKNDYVESGFKQNQNVNNNTNQNNLNKNESTENLQTTFGGKNEATNKIKQFYTTENNNKNKLYTTENSLLSSGFVSHTTNFVNTHSKTTNTPNLLKNTNVFATNLVKNGNFKMTTMPYNNFKTTINANGFKTNNFYSNGNTNNFKTNANNFKPNTNNFKSNSNNFITNTNNFKTTSNTNNFKMNSNTNNFKTNNNMNDFKTSNNMNDFKTTTHRNNFKMASNSNFGKTTNNFVKTNGNNLYSTQNYLSTTSNYELLNKNNQFMTNTENTKQFLTNTQMPVYPEENTEANFDFFSWLTSGNENTKKINYNNNENKILSTMQTMYPPPVSLGTDVKNTSPILGLLQKEITPATKIETTTNIEFENFVTTLLPLDQENNIQTTTVPTSSMTTDALFKHYKQPSEPLKGPMYLIIQGHSKVKTYGPSKVIHGIKIQETNEIQSAEDEFNVKHLHNYKKQPQDKSNNRIGKSANLQTLTHVVKTNFGALSSDLLGDNSNLNVKRSDDNIQETELRSSFSATNAQKPEKYYKGIVESARKLKDVDE